MKIQRPTFQFRSRLKASAIHLLISLVVALAAAVLVFAVWYPWPYREISGGQGLFLLVVSVDLVLGPLLTFAIFDLAKGWRHLKRDLAVIGLLQLAALGYGIHTVFVVRPVALVFEVDRFRAISAMDVHRVELPKAPEAYRQLPLDGPWLLGTRRPEAGSERNEAIFMGITGIDVAQRPTLWQPYERSKADAVARARPASALFKQYPAQRAELEALFRDLKVSAADIRFLPLQARLSWVVLLNGGGDVIGFAPVDGFF